VEKLTFVLGPAFTDKIVSAAAVANAAASSSMKQKQMNIKAREEPPSPGDAYSRSLAQQIVVRGGGTLKSTPPAFGKTTHVGVGGVGGRVTILSGFSKQGGGDPSFPATLAAEGQSLRHSLKERVDVDLMVSRAAMLADDGSSTRKLAQVDAKLDTRQRARPEISAGSGVELQGVDENGAVKNVPVQLSQVEALRVRHQLRSTNVQAGLQRQIFAKR
jgi:hypothetical protein